MNPDKPLNEPRAPYGAVPPDAGPDLKGSYQAMLRAADRARELALHTRTDLIRVKNGRVVRVKPVAAESGRNE